MKCVHATGNIQAYLHLLYDWHSSAAEIQIQLRRQLSLKIKTKLRHKHELTDDQFIPAVLESYADCLLLGNY